MPDVSPVRGYALDEQGHAVPIFRGEDYRGKVYPSPAEAKAAGPQAKKRRDPLPITSPLPPEEADPEMVPEESADREASMKEESSTATSGAPANGASPRRTAGVRVQEFLAADPAGCAAKREADGMKGLYAAYEAFEKARGEKPVAFNTFQFQAYKILKAEAGSA